MRRPTQRTGVDAICEYPGRSARSRLLATRCWPGLPATAASMCRRQWPQFSAAEIRAMRGIPYPDLAFARAHALRRRRDREPSLRAHGARSLCDVPSRGRLPAGPDRCRTASSWSCSMARRWPSRTWPCSCWRGSWTMCLPSAARAPRSPAPPRAIPAGRRSRRSPGATAPTSSSCFPTVASRRCSSGR